MFLALTPAKARAEDSAPTQNADAQRGFSEPSAAEKRNRQKKIEYMRLGKRVLVQWPKVPLAIQYRVELSNSQYFGRIVSEHNVTDTAFETEPLRPGRYYYRVHAYSQHGLLKTLDVKDFLVEEPESIFDTFDSTGSAKKRLTPPVLMTPDEGAVFPLESRIRLSWVPQENARSYRVRLWYVENTVPDSVVPWHSHQAHPIWTTEVQNPWIVVRDVPYSSFIAMKAGLYRWDVSSIHERTGTPSTPAVGHFEISKYPADFIAETVLRPFIRVDPFFVYQTRSNVTGLRTQDRYFATNGGVEATFWTSPHWGLNAQATVSNFTARFSNSSGAPATKVVFFNTDVTMLYRTRFSPYPDEWRFTTGLGIGLHEFPQVDKVLSFNRSVSVARPKSLGLAALLKLQHAISKSMAVVVQNRLLIPFTTLSLPAESRTDFSPNLTMYAGIQNQKTCKVCFGLGIFGQYRSVAFEAKPDAVTRLVVFPNQPSFVRLISVGVEGSTTFRF